MQSEPDGTFSVLWEPERNGMYGIKAVSSSGIFVFEDFWYTSLKELKRLQKVLLEGNSEDIAEVLNDEDSLNTLEINTELLKGRNVQNSMLRMQSSLHGLSRRKARKPFRCMPKFLKNTMCLLIIRLYMTHLITAQ